MRINSLLMRCICNSQKLPEAVKTLEQALKRDRLGRSDLGRFPQEQLAQRVEHQRNVHDRPHAGLSLLSIYARRTGFR
jgi:hypothetical protein